jgi:peptide-methionine (S)-S-oxide reductase
MKVLETVKSVTLGVAIVLGLFLNTPDAEASGNTEKLVVAGGCFWCVEADFEKVKGVVEAVSGYTGGTTKNPTYKQVTRGGTGHFEAVEISFDPTVVSLDVLLNLFLRSVDVTDNGGQFCDRGESYRTAIFPASPSQRKAAEKAIKEAQRELGKTVVTPVLDLKTFYLAEDYHQDYYKGENLVLTRFGPISQKNAYKRYRDACGRDARVKQVWGTGAAPFIK